MDKDYRFIKILPKDLAGCIAAGEVVQGFSSIVRELIENAVDSRAKNIFVTFCLDEPFSIIIEDDGCGIKDEDLSILTTKHATSKIDNFEDIFTSHFCGFRGEALFSISAFSKFLVITSTTNDGVATEAHYDGSVLTKKKQVARERGTTVHVSDIFFNVPVRKKFLKKDSFERIEVKRTLILYILAHPNISFRYYTVINGKKNLELSIPSVFGLRERIIKLFSREGLSKNLLAVTPLVKKVKSNFSFSGYISSYRLYYSNNKNQYLFYRGRAIESPAFYKAVREAYKHFIPKQYYPMIFLNLHTKDPFLIDVNFHPAKREVLFKVDSSPYKDIYNVVSSILQEHMHVSAVTGRGVNINFPKKNPSVTVLNPTNDRMEEAYVQNFMKKHTGNDDDSSVNQGSLQQNLEHPKNFSENSSENLYDAERKSIGENPLENHENSHKKSDFLDFFSKEKIQTIAIFGQVASLYIVFSMEKDLYLMDQHAAHERIHYDFLLKERVTDNPERQSLLIPFIFEKTPLECEILLSRRSTDMLKKLGIVLSCISENKIAVEEVPSFLNDKQREKVVKEALNACLENDNQKMDDFFREIVARWACRMSVMAGDVLTHDQMRELVEEVICRNYQITCPHGRPFVKKISFSELNSFFDRGRHILPNSADRFNLQS